MRKASRQRCLEMSRRDMTREEPDQGVSLLPTRAPGVRVEGILVFLSACIFAGAKELFFGGNVLICLDGRSNPTSIHLCWKHNMPYQLGEFNLGPRRVYGYWHRKLALRKSWTAMGVFPRGC